MRSRASSRTSGPRRTHPADGRPLTEILFFHLQRQPLEKVLPVLILRSLERGWRALIKAASPERMEALDDCLWSFSDGSFVPHGTDKEADPAAQPVLLTLSEANANSANVLFLVEGAGMPADLSPYERVTLLFDGADDESVAQARRTWSEVKKAGLAASYWQESPAGRWEKKA
jgi:DNA polymerase-3 subunit chi